MTRRKGEITSGQRERYFPHLCALAEVNGGFAETYMEMLAFCRERGVQLQSGHRRAWDRRIHVTYCFADPAIADEFAARFGGVRGTAETYPPGVIGRHGIVSTRR